MIPPPISFRPYKLDSHGERYAPYCRQRILRKLTLNLHNNYISADYKEAIRSLFQKERDLTPEEEEAIRSCNKLDKGAFGKVMRLPNGMVAKIQIEEHLFEKDRTIFNNEAKFLELFSRYTHVPHLETSIKVNYLGRSCLCFCMEDGHQALKHRSTYHLPFIKKTAEMLLEVLAVMHSKKTAHLDIKPSNCTIDKLVDGGTVTLFLSGPKSERKKTTDFYAAPEIFEGLPYDWRADLWSLGCTLFELYTGDYLIPVQYGQNRSQWYQEIIENNGRGLKKKIVKAYRKKLGPDESAEDLIQFIDLLQQLLKLDPKERISARKALKHPLFALEQRTHARCFFDLSNISQIDGNWEFKIKNKSGDVVHERKVRFVNPEVFLHVPIKEGPFIFELVSPEKIFSCPVDAVMDRCKIRFSPDLARVDVLPPEPLPPDPIKPNLFRLAVEPGYIPESRGPLFLGIFDPDVVRE